LRDDALVALAREVLQGSSKVKQIPQSFLQCRIDEIESALPAGRVDPSCIALKDPAEPMKLPDWDDSKGDRPTVKEIEEFPDPQTQQPIPHTYFANLLYVYPEFINFEKYRNIACNVQIRNSDASVSGEGLKVIPGKSSTSAFVSCAWTQVNYHKKTVTPQEEIKIMLPLTLTPTSHLFFTFYKVSCKNNPGFKEVVGHSVLPLYIKNRIPPDDTYYLPIASKLPKNYLIPFHEGKETDELKFLHNGAKSFRVRIKLVSTIFQQDHGINDFLALFPSDRDILASKEQSEKQLRRALSSLQSADDATLIKFSAALFNYLNEQLVTRTTPLARYGAFLAIAVIAHKVAMYTNEESRAWLLSAYVQHKLDNVNNVPLYPYILEQWQIGNLAVYAPAS